MLKHHQRHLKHGLYRKQQVWYVYRHHKWAPPLAEISWEGKHGALWASFGARAFAIAGPTVWNSLPDSLRDPAVGPDQFRRDLKTYLFEWHCVSFSALAVFSRNALYKSTFYLLTYWWCGQCSNEVGGHWWQQQHPFQTNKQTNHDPWTNMDGWKTNSADIRISRIIV